MNLKELRRLYRAGDLKGAQAGMRALTIPRRLSREERLSIAFLALEIRMPEVSIRALYPVIFPSGSGDATPPSPNEIAEYAMALVAIGCNGQAKRMLLSIDTSSIPQAEMALINSHFRDWQWEDALPLIEHLRQTPMLKKRESFSVRLDYAIALLYGKKEFARSRQFLGELLSELPPKEFPAIRFDAHLIVLVSHFLEGDLTESSRAIERVSEVYGEAASPFLADVVDMWRTLIELCSASGRKTNLDLHLLRLRTLRERFVDLGRSNFARFCDYYASMVTRMPELALRLYFGSPYQPAAQGRAMEILRQIGHEIPGNFSIARIGSADASRRISFNLLSDIQFPGSRNKSLRLKVGQLPHRLFVALLQDPYFIPSAIQLFERTYPDDHFDPFHSIKRIEQGLIRLRQELAQARMPVRISAKRGTYRLESKYGIEARVSRPSAADGARSAMWMDRLRTYPPNRRLSRG